MPKIDPTLGTIDPYLPSEIKPLLYYYDEYQTYDLIYNYGFGLSNNFDSININEFNILNLDFNNRKIAKILDYNPSKPYVLLERFTPINVPTSIIEVYNLAISDFRKIYNFFLIENQDNSNYNFPYFDFNNYINIEIDPSIYPFEYCNIYYLYGNSDNSFSWHKVKISPKQPLINILGITPFSLYIESDNDSLPNFIYGAIDEFFLFTNLINGLQTIKNSLSEFYENYNKFKIKKAYVEPPESGNIPITTFDFEYGITPDIFNEEIMIVANNNFWDQDMVIPTDKGTYWVYSTDSEKLEILPYAKEKSTGTGYNSDGYNQNWYYHPFLIKKYFKVSGFVPFLYFNDSPTDIRNKDGINPDYGLSGNDIINLADNKYY